MHKSAHFRILAMHNLGGCDGGPPKCRIYNKYSIFLHSTTKNGQKSPSTTNPIILQSTTDFSEILQHFVRFIKPLFFMKISPQIQKFDFKVLITC